MCQLLEAQERISESLQALTCSVLTGEAVAGKQCHAADIDELVGVGSMHSFQQELTDRVHRVECLLFSCSPEQFKAIDEKLQMVCNGRSANPTMPVETECEASPAP